MVLYLQELVMQKITVLSLPTKIATTLSCSLLLSAIPLVASAVTHSKFPLGCRNIGFEFKKGLLHLKPSLKGKKYEQSLYFLHNITHQNILFAINKAPEHKFGPNYKNVISPGNWGVFAVDFKHFTFSCSERSFSGEAISYGDDCKQLVRVCQYNNAKFAEHNLGTYWNVSNTTRHEAIRSAIDSGILLRS